MFSTPMEPSASGIAQGTDQAPETPDQEPEISKEGDLQAETPSALPEVAEPTESEDGVTADTEADGTHTGLSHDPEIK